MVRFIALMFMCLIGLRAEAAELLMVEQRGCHWCEVWNDEIGGIYARTDEGQVAPLRRLDLHDGIPDDLDLQSRPQFTPTFILLDNGREVGRIEGYPGEHFFWPLLGNLLKKLPAPAAG